MGSKIKPFRKQTNVVEQRNLEYIRSFKDRACLDCGIKYHSEVMEFDHLSDKLFTLSKPGRRSLETIQIELSKCELVCANCHRMRTWKRRQESIVNKIKEPDLFDLA